MSPAQLARRLDSLADKLAPQPVAAPVTLPLSGLAQLAPGLLLFRNSPHA